MSESIDEKPTLKPKAKKPKRPLKAVTTETAKLLAQLREKANKKNFGRPVKECEIIELALGLITQEHLRELQERTVRHKDRVRAAFAAYQRAHGKLSLDEFVAGLLSGKIQPSAAGTFEISKS